MNKKATLVAVIVFFLLVVGIFFVGKPVVEFMVVGDVQYVLRDRDYEIWGRFHGRGV